MQLSLPHDDDISGNDDCNFVRDLHVHIMQKIGGDRCLHNDDDNDNKDCDFDGDLHVHILQK